MRYPNTSAVGSYAIPSPSKPRPEAFVERSSRRKSVAWQQEQQQRIRANLGEGTLGRRGSGDGGGFSTTNVYARATDRGGNLTGGAGPEVERGGEGDRKKVLLILRKLEDHGRVSRPWFCGSRGET